MIIAIIVACIIPGMGIVSAILMSDGSYIENLPPRGSMPL